MRMPYVVSTLNFHQNDSYFFNDDFSADIEFWNFGFTPVNINGIVLNTDQRFSIKCNEGECDRTKYAWQFSSDPIYALTNRTLLITVKRYTQMAARQAYVLSVLTFTDNNSYSPGIDTTGDVLLINTGNGPVVINGAISLQTGQSLGVQANFNESDQSKYSWFFVAGFTQPSLTIVIKRF